MTLPTYINLVAALVDPNTSLLAPPTMTTPGYGWCIVSIAMTLTKNALPNADGFVTWTNVANAPLSSITTTKILFNTVNYVPAYVGVYTLDLLYSWS